MELKLRGIKKSYNKEVLKGIDLDLTGYQAIGIIGRSGCGKSTLLRLLAGMEDPDQGAIQINGMTVNRSSRKAYQRQIGMVFQQHNLFPHLTLLRNITLILEKIRGYSEGQAEKIGKDLLSQLHLKDEMHKHPSKVSGGQAQRAAIARALSTDPDLIFMDEPTAALDPILTREVLDAVTGLKDSGKAFVFVTHEISFVRDFADYVVFMEDGRIAENGERQILSAPKTHALRAFLQAEESSLDKERKGERYDHQRNLRLV